MAQAIANSFTQALAADGWNPPTASWEELQSNPSFAAMRAVAGRQPKASKTPPLVSEYKHTISIVGPMNLVRSPPCSLMARLKQPWNVRQGFDNSVSVVPMESQLLRISQTRSRGGKNPDKPVAKLIWGVPWDCNSFVSQAVAKGHPRAFGSLVPEVLQEAVEKNRVMSSKDLADLRAKWFKKWVPRAKALASCEAEFKQSLAPHLQQS